MDQRTTRYLTAFALGVCVAACGGASTDLPEPNPLQSAPIQVVPSPGLPAEYFAVAGMSNNNLDITRHDGRVFLAIRTSADHFASTASRIMVMSSTDEVTWDWEATFSTDSDAREPRLLSFNGRLFLYFAKLGLNRESFDPQGMLLTERTAAQNWTAPRAFYGDGSEHDNYIPWRAKVRNGRAWMTTYRGGQHIYDLSGDPIDIELLVSDDGATWVPYNPQHPIVSTGGGSETDFDFDDHGDLYAVIRNEEGDTTGFGSKICTAKKGALDVWRCTHDPKKYDSPLVFMSPFDGNVLLVGRRNVTDTGNYELAPGVEWSLAAWAQNQLSYSAAAKACALWQVDRKTLTVRYIADVPGHGDTCFASIVSATEGDTHHLTLYNYSSPLDGDATIGWMTGQVGETRIYRTELDFPVH